MTTWALDIETCSTSNAAVIDIITAKAASKTPPSKKAEETWFTDSAIDARVSSALRETSLDPLLAEPIVIDLYNGGTHYTAAIYDQDEPELMAEFEELWEQLVTMSDIVTGHNIKNYDLKILGAAFQRCGIIPPPSFPFWNGRYFTGPTCIIDTLELVGEYAATGKKISRSLDSMGAVYGIPAKAVNWKGQQMTGARVAEAYKAGEHDMLIEYCRGDTEASLALFNRLTFDGSLVGKSRHSDLADSLAEIDASDMSGSAKWQTAKALLFSASLISRTIGGKNE